MDLHGLRLLCCAMLCRRRGGGDGDDRDCLNLREGASLESAVIRCLPTGTRLAIADLWDAPEKYNRAWVCDAEHCWAWVRTEEGENGFVALTTGSVVWTQR